MFVLDHWKTLFEERKPDPPVSTRDLPSGEHYTHSRTRNLQLERGAYPTKPVQGNNTKSKVTPLPLRKGGQSLLNPVQVVHL